VINDVEWPFSTGSELDKRGELDKLSLGDQFEAHRLLKHATAAISEDLRLC
jgi:hypothetical protein